MGGVVDLELQKRNDIELQLSRELQRQLMIMALVTVWILIREIVITKRRNSELVSSKSLSLSVRASGDCSPSSSSSHQVSLSYASSEQGVSQGTYDVFLSCIGEDTRRGFVSHLYKALVDRGIHTFRNDKHLDRGKALAPEFLKTIRDSKIAIVVFSKKYSSSSYFLDELVHIMENDNLRVIPVFYDVDTSDIQQQRKEVAEVLSKAIIQHGTESANKLPKGMKILTKSFSKKATKLEDQLRKWKEELTKDGRISGWDVVIDRDESECIRQIVGSVFLELSLTHIKDREHLVGMKRRADKVISMLRVEEVDTVRMVGISGMAGAGKTALASYIFRKLSSSYGASCFLQIAVGERWDVEYMNHLKSTLLSKIDNSGSEYKRKDDKGAYIIRDKLRVSRVLIVVDNVYDEQQLEDLEVNHDILGNGSRVIITTRDFNVLDKADEKYNMELLRKNEAVKLFSFHAFGNRSHRLQNFVEISHQATNCAGGLPLALNLLGCLLRESKDPEQWSSTMSELQNYSSNDKLDSIVLISFDRLNEVEKRILIDISCFLEGDDISNVIKILGTFDDFPEKKIRNLVEKSLVSIDQDLNALEERKLIINVHDLVQQMVSTIVRKEHPASRLWEEKEVINVLNGAEECEAVESIVLINNRETGHLSISGEALMRMKKLRILRLSGVECSTGLKNFPSALQWINWEGYPFDSLPASFEGKDLVGLILTQGRIIKPITGSKRLWNLKIMDCSNCKFMTATPNFSRVPCLEELYLCHCTNMVKVHSSFGGHRRLRLVNLKGCIKLENFPEIVHRMDSLEELSLKQTAIKRLPLTAGNLTGLRELNLSCCEKFEHTSAPFIHQSDEDKETSDSAINLSYMFAITSEQVIFVLPSFLQMTCLDLRNCHLAHFFIPESCLPYLVELKLGNNNLRELLISKKCFSSIKLLDLFENNCVHQKTDKHNLFSSYKDGSTISLISCNHESEQPQTSVGECSSQFDWEAVLGVLHGMHPDLSICFPGVDIPECFKYKITGYQCEIILPHRGLSPGWFNNNLRGLAICAVAKKGVGLRVKHPKREIFSHRYNGVKADQLVFYFTPSKYFACKVSALKKIKSQEQFCILHDNGNMKWGIKLMYQDEDEEVHNIKLITRNKDDANEPNNVGEESYLKVICMKATDVALK